MYARVAERVPAFGGTFVDEATNSIYIWTTNGKQADASAARNELIINQGSESDDQLAKMNLRVLKAKHGFRTLKAWMDRATEDLFQVDGVVLTDIDDRNNRLEVGVTSTAAESATRDWARANGVPDDSISISISQPGQGKVLLQDLERPITGGLQIENDVAGPCSLGVNARRSGTQGFITAGHCTAIDGYDYGPFFQPFRPNTIGFEAEFAHVYSGGSCPPGNLCKHADVLFAGRASGVTFSQGRVGYTALNSNVYNEPNNWIIKGETGPSVNQGINKVGAVTGRTFGTTSGACVNIRNDDPESFDLGILFTCQSTSNDLVADVGDSGSPVIKPVGGTAPWYWVNFKGILWYRTGDGRFVWSNIGNITNALGQLDTCLDYLC